MSGNGVDIGTVYALLREVANRGVTPGEQVARIGQTMATKQELAALRAETQADIKGLRETVAAYHATVMGHGILYSELDERARRTERRSDMGAAT